jgi:uncharacterized protein (TIGR00299 family) protein
MKVAYFDCFSGASGDMILGSLLDAGLDINDLKKELSKLNLSGYEILTKKENRKGISGIKFSVKLMHDHKHRNLDDICQIIDTSSIDNDVKNQSKSIFQRLAVTEAKIHDKSVDEIHFHEVGAVDAIVDIVGTVVGLRLLRIQEVHSSRLHLGTGFVECAHGTLPVPAPATLELVKGIPVYSTGIEEELVTPTGAAILSTLSRSFGQIPCMRIEKSGYGLGSRDISIPNVLRVIIGETEKDLEEDTVQLIETNIDDMNPQFYDHVMELLYHNGAKEVFLTPVYMKKNRPGTLLSAIASPENVDSLVHVILRETTTLGVRISDVKKRKILTRKSALIETELGKVRVKISGNGDKKTIQPEYEDCKKLAKKHNIPIREVFDEVKRVLNNQ